MTELRWNDIIGAPATAAEARLELAAVCRLIAREGFAPIGAARLAARDPERPGVFFVNPGALLLDQITASNLIEVDRDGRHMGTGEAEPDSGALAMVLAALEAKPGAAAAAQIASAAGTVVAALEGGLQPITQTA
ncbi:MAG: class II aldolase/adducin family protein, partial [Rickettsiales bacterium]